jgi:hypothetical protein
MRRGDGPILSALFGVAIVTAIVRPPDLDESTDDGSREAAVVTAGSASPTHASPEAAAACAHAAEVPRAAGRWPTTSRDTVDPTRRAAGAARRNAWRTNSWYTK